jgi:predicted transcriptional regulator
MNHPPLPNIEAHRLHRAPIELVHETPRARAASDDLPALEADTHTASDELAAKVHQPISAVMDHTLWTVHAENSIETVEAILAEQGLTSAPVVGSNGAIVGMIGTPELVQFHADGKNAKAVQAWEISRIKHFEVSPGDTVEEVAKLMAENKVESVSVTEFGRLKGVVSTQDLLQEILKVLPDEHPE